MKNPSNDNNKTYRIITKKKDNYKCQASKNDFEPLTLVDISSGNIISCSETDHTSSVI